MGWCRRAGSVAAKADAGHSGYGRTDPSAGDCAAVGFAAYGYSFYLFLTWLPGYLEQTLHMSILRSAGYATIPWIFASLSDLLIGGFLIDYLIARGPG